VGGWAAGVLGGLRRLGIYAIDVCRGVGIGVDISDMFSWGISPATFNSAKIPGDS